MMKEELVELTLHKRAAVSPSEWLLDYAGSSMVALHPKQTRDIDFKPALVGYISSHYYEDGEKYSIQFNRLTEMRRLCCDPSWTDQQIENLFTYYNQLYFIDRRFFPSRHDGRITFDWYDAFSGARSSQKSIAFEKGSILFNIGVLYAQKGARRNRQTVSGLEAAATDFRSSSGVFRFLRDNFQHAPSVDMQTPLINVLVQLMLSQARECVVEQLLLDRTPGGASDQPCDLLHYVELAQECTSLAASHSELTTSMSTTPVRGRLPAVWEKLMLSKRSYYSSLAHYNISLALLQLSSVVDAQQRNRLIHVLMNCHSRAAAALVEQTLRRPVYTDAAVETDYGRLLLAKAHIRQSVLSSEEAIKIVTEHDELEELRTSLQTIRDRSLRKFSELELEDDFTELQLAPEVCARSKLHIEPIQPDFVQFKVDDLFHQLGCLSIFSARHEWTPPRPITLTWRCDEELGFTVRGEAPVMVATVDDSSPAQLAGVRVGDLIVNVGDVDVKWARHAKVVAMIRDAGLAVRLCLVTPLQRHFTNSHAVSSPGQELEPTSVPSFCVEANREVHSTLDVPSDASLSRTAQIETPRLSRHWGFRRRKREKTS